MLEFKIGGDAPKVLATLKATGEYLELRNCPNCKKETMQEIKLYNPDDPIQGHIFECSECKENVGFAD